MWYGKGPGVDRSRRRVPPRQFRRHLEARRRARPDGRRPHRRIVHHRAPVRVQFRRRDDPDPQPRRACRRSSTTGSTAGRCRASPAPGSALKCMHETVESTAVIDGSLDRLNIVIPGPDDFQMPDGGLNIRLGDTVLGMEARLHDYKRDAMLAFVRANRLNRRSPRAGATRRSASSRSASRYLDVRQALDELGIDEVTLQRPRPAHLQDRLPVAARQRRSCRSSPRGLELIIVVEEKRSLIEVQVREELYGTANQPVCIGKKDEQRQLAVPGQGRARSERHRDLPRRAPAEIRQRREPRRPRRAPQGGAARAAPRRRTSRCACRTSAPAARTIPRPWCRRAAAPMPASAATTWSSGWTARRSASPRWAARAPTGSARRRSPSAPHVFQNIGDGTYNHSGYLAIRARDRVRRQHHLQDPVQRRGRHDRRPDERRRPHGAADRPPGRGRRRQARRRRHRRAATNIPPAPTGRTALTVHHRDDLDAVQRELARDPGLHGADLRPDLRGGKAPPPQARHSSPIPTSA